jgi:hypothetical protein
VSIVLSTVVGLEVNVCVVSSYVLPAALVIDIFAKAPGVPVIIIFLYKSDIII